MAEWERTVAMNERKSFDIGDVDFEIILHPDGRLTIEASAEYGDSYTGWGSTTKTACLSPAQVMDFIKFLLSAR